MRLVLVLAAGLLVAQIAGFALHMQERSELLARASGMQSAQRIADIVNLIDPMSAAERKSIAQVLNTPPLRLSFERAPIEPARNIDAETLERAARFASMLRRHLDDERAVTVDATRSGYMTRKGRGPGKRVREDTANAPPETQPGPTRTRRGKEAAAFTFVAQVTLRDGTLATFDTSVTQAVISWPYRLLLSIALLLTAVLLVSWIAVRWATRPLKALADAADALGGNINRPPMAESGPVEVVRAARAFNTMQSRLVAHMRERTQVLAAMSHDLKTPITRLRLRAEMLEDEAQRAKFANDLQEMETMVKAALDFLRGVETSEPVQAVDIMALLESLQSDLRETGHRVEIAGSVQTPYRGRAQALKRCISNLAENAVKYGGHAHIVVEDSAAQLLLRIQDSGPGIPPEQLEKVFEPFYRIESSRNRDTGGSGLGLAIARGVAELHGGGVTLLNRKEGGLEAVVVLPRT
jgi:signal transduction histidine kinase